MNSSTPSTGNALSRLRAALLALALFCSVTTGIVLTTTTVPAAACGVGSICNDGSDEGDTPVGNPGDGPPPSNACQSNCDDGGSGGLTTPGTFGYTGTVWQPAKPPSPIGGGNHMTSKGIVWSDATKTYRYNNKCEGDHTWWDRVQKRTRSAPWLGTRWEIFGTFRPAYTDPDSGFEVPDQYTTTSGGYECIPPPEYEVYVWTCVIKGTASYDGPYANPVETASMTKLGAQKTRFTLDGKKNPDWCAEPSNFSWEVSALGPDGKPKWPWGRYELEAVSWLQDCNYVDYTTINQYTKSWNPNSLHCYGSPYKGEPGNDRIELFCSAPYFHKPGNTWDNLHSFTAEDCVGDSVPGGPDPGSWTCGPTPDPVFNGRSSPNNRFDVLDDAKERRIKWDRPDRLGGISGGVRDITKRTVRLALGHNVSPYRSGEVPNSDRQPFKVVPQVDEWKSNWQQAMPAGNDSETGWDMAFMAPGVPSKPFTVEPTWAFEAEFLTKTVKSIKIDSETKKWSVTLQDFWYTAAADCPGNPASLDVYRARNSQGN